MYCTSFKQVIQATINCPQITTIEHLELEIDRFTKELKQTAWDNPPEIKRKIIGSHMATNTLITRQNPFNRPAAERNEKSLILRMSQYTNPYLNYRLIKKMITRYQIS